MATFAKLNVALTSTASGFLVGMKSANAAVKKLGDTGRRTSAKLSLAFGKITSSVKGLAGSFGLLFGAAGVLGAIKRVEAFNATMARSTAIMRGLSDEMRTGFIKEAQRIGTVTSFSATEAAESIFFLASAGLDATQVLQNMGKVAKFAQAANFDLATATDLLTDAQSALGLTVKDATKNSMNLSRVSNVLIKANTLANASAQQFAEALTTKSAAAARILGKDIEETVAVLAAFADQGTKGAEAGTQLSIVFRDLQTKALKNVGAFKEANVSVFDASGEMRNMADILSDLENKLAGASDATKKLTLLQLGFSDKSVSALQALIGLSGKIRKYEEDIRSAGNITDAVAADSITNLQKALNKLSGEWDTLAQKSNIGIEIFVRSGGIISKSVNAFGDGVSIITQKILDMNFTLEDTVNRALGFDTLTDKIEASIRAMQKLAEETKKFQDALPKAGTLDQPVAIGTQKATGLPRFAFLAKSATELEGKIAASINKTAFAERELQFQLAKRLDLQKLLADDGVFQAQKIAKAFQGVGASIFGRTKQVTIPRIQIVGAKLLQGFKDLRLGEDFAEAVRSAKSIKESIKTPIQKFVDGADTLEKLFKFGLIDKDEFKLATKRLEESLGLKDEKKLKVKVPEILALKDIDKKIQEAIFKSAAEKEQKLFQDEQLKEQVLTRKAVEALKGFGLVFAGP